MWVFFSLDASAACSLVLLCKIPPALHNRICKFTAAHETHGTDLLCTTKNDLLVWGTVKDSYARQVIPALSNPVDYFEYDMH